MEGPPLGGPWRVQKHSGWFSLNVPTTLTAGMPPGAGSWPPPTVPYVLGCGRRDSRPGPPPTAIPMRQEIRGIERAPPRDHLPETALWCLRSQDAVQMAPGAPQGLCRLTPGPAPPGVDHASRRTLPGLRGPLRTEPGCSGRGVPVHVGAGWCERWDGRGGAGPWG